MSDLQSAIDQARACGEDWGKALARGEFEPWDGEIDGNDADDILIAFDSDTPPTAREWAAIKAAFAVGYELR